MFVINERGLTSADGAVYNNNTKRTRYSSVPSSDIATRPLAIRKDGTWYTYGWDLTKNICEVFGQHGYLRTAYTYSPFGDVTADGDITQPIQWSSEFLDTELALVYYNYRHYNPADGRWTGRDRIPLQHNTNLYFFSNNTPTYIIDILGNAVQVVADVVFDANTENHATPQTFQGIIDNVTSKLSKKKCVCLSELTIVIHGDPSLSVMGDGHGVYNRGTNPKEATVIDSNNAKALFEAFNKALADTGVKYCKNCTIWYLSCNTGLSTFVQTIANTTGCSVYAPKGYCRANVKNPARSIIRAEDQTTGADGNVRVLSDLSKDSKNKQKAEDGMFRVYVPHGTGYNQPRKTTMYEDIKAVFKNIFSK